MVLYNSIGQGYNDTPKSDPRIVETLINLLDLPPGKTLADVGAGTGNYSNAIADKGYEIIAIEPSTVMQSQAVFHPNSYRKSELNFNRLKSKRITSH